MTREFVISQLKEKINSATNQMSCTNPQEVYEEAIKLLEQPTWHTEEPTEEGWYLVYVKHPNETSEYCVDVWLGNEWYWFSKMEVVAWQKIEPYEEYLK